MHEMPTHIVAVGGLVQNDNGEVLLVKNPRRGWEFPGGQVEVGESLPQALKREIREEGGVEAEVYGIVGIYSNTSKRPGYNGVKEIPTIVNIDFRCRYLSGDLVTSEESIDVGWFTIEEAKTLITKPLILERFTNMTTPSPTFPCNACTRQGDVINIIERYNLET